MAQSLSTVAIHVIFSTQFRFPYLKSEYRSELFSYLTGIAKKNFIEDHVHILCGLPRTMSIAKLVEHLKRSSSKWLKTKNDTLRAFAWQSGYGVFSVSPSKIDVVRQYIRGQEQHHKRSTFQNELLAFLKSSGTQFDEKYLWD